MKGAKGFQLYKDEISTGISAYTFLRGFGKDKESGRWIWKGSGGGTGAEAGPGAGGRGPAGGNREGKEKEKEKEKIQEKDGSLEVKREMVNDLAEEEGLGELAVSFFVFDVRCSIFLFGFFFVCFFFFLSCFLKEISGYLFSSWSFVVFSFVAQIHSIRFDFSPIFFSLHPRLHLVFYRRLTSCFRDSRVLWVLPTF